MSDIKILLPKTRASSTIVTPAFEERGLDYGNTSAKELDLLRPFDQSEYAHVLCEA